MQLTDAQWRWKFSGQLQLANMEKTVDLLMHSGFLQFVGTEQVKGVGWRGSATMLVEIEVPGGVERGRGVNINLNCALTIAKELACALRQLGQSEGCHDMWE